MKIIYINRGPGIAGGQRVIHEHLERLHARGHEAGLLFLNGATDFWLDHSYPIVGADALEGADVVVATSWPTAYVVAQLPTDARKFYLVQGRASLFYDDTAIKTKADAENTYDLPLNLITIAPWLQQMLKDEHGREAALIRNGVNEVFSPDGEKLERDTEYVVLVEGSAHSMAKDVALRAVPVIEKVRAALGDRVAFWLFTHDEAYRDRVGPVCDRVFFRPEQAEIPKLYRSADVMLKLSRFEGAPCPIVEAMASGCVPVVGLEVYDENTAMGDGDIEQAVNGLVSAYHDVEGIADGVINLLDTPSMREELRANGLSYVQKHLQWEPIIDGLETLYATDPEQSQRWAQAQTAEAGWWKGYVTQELGNPTLSVFIGHRRQQLKDALRKFGFWRDQNYHELPAGRWLDAGSGPVSMLQGTAQCEVLAVDPLMRQYANELATVCTLGTAGNVTYQAAGMEAVEGEFDATWCWNVLDHTENWRAALDNLITVTRGGGHLWLMTHCRPPHRLDTHHTQSYSPADVVQALVEGGFDIAYVHTERQIGTQLEELYVRAVKQEATSL